jgi:hypothetical protein
MLQQTLRRPLLILLTLTLSVTLAAGCEGERPTGPKTTPDTGTTLYPDGGFIDDAYLPPPATVDSAPVPSPDGPPAASCPALDGDWVGTLQGQTTGLFKFNVTGTMSFTLAPGSQPGDYVLTSGQMVSTAKGFEAFPFKYAMQGVVNCGALDATNSADIFGVKTQGTAKCAFHASGCKGSWTGASTDGSSQGSGTFEVHRKTP